MPVASKLFISFDDVVKEFGVESKQLQEWVNDGKLRTYRFHHTMNFKRKDVQELLGGPAPGLPPDLESLLPKPIEDEWNDEKIFPLSVPPAEPSGSAARSPAAGEPAAACPKRDSETDELTAPVSTGQRLPAARSSNSGTADEDEEETFLEPLEGGKPAPIGAAAAGQSAQPGRPVRFRCWCGKHLKSDLKYVGQTVDCPRCGQALPVPSEEEARLLAMFPPGIHKYLKKLRRDQKAMKEEMAQLVTETKRLLEEGSTMDEDHPTDAIPTAAGEERLSQLEQKVKELERGIRAMSTDIAQLLKQNEETRFDIARLYDLMSRVAPVSAIPAKPIRQATAKAADGG